MIKMNSPAEMVDPELSSDENVEEMAYVYSKHDVSSKYHQTSLITSHRVPAIAVSLDAASGKLMKSCANHLYINSTSTDFRQTRQNSSFRSHSSSLPSNSLFHAHRNFFNFYISLLVTNLFALTCLSSNVSAAESVATVDRMDSSGNQKFMKFLSILLAAKFSYLKF